jgi:hypothetical protein
MAYEKPVRAILREFAATKSQGEVFTRADMRSWVQTNYPSVRLNTADRQTTALTTNIESRKFWNPKAGEDDVFFRLRPNAGDLRLYDKAVDPPPIYAGNGGRLSDDAEEPDDESSEFLEAPSSQQFALEHHLRDFLARDVSLIEPGMRLFTEIEGIDGVEVPMGANRSADLVTIDSAGNLVVIELKVSRGHEKTLGQLLRYIGYTAKQYSNGRKVRGIIIASEISSDLRLAVEPLSAGGLDFKLMKYGLKFDLSPA